jgi:dTDP-4-dehydro-6-deoxy-alpha-D-glucopyranose 2,3-dehydratase
MSLLQPGLVRPRSSGHSRLTERLMRSAAETGAGAQVSTEEARRWLTERRAAHHFQVERIPLGELRDWSFDPGSGNLGHDTGRFFTVEGVEAVVGEDSGLAWQQPIIVQPEIGILGILAKEFDGVLHLLMQAKMEPGNPNLLQLSPTVQATRSNYTRAHRGSAVRYLELFASAPRTDVLVDVLQSEHGAWFLHKANRNMLVEAPGDVAGHEDFRWLTIGQIGELLRLDNVVNMNARTILSCIETFPQDESARNSDSFVQSWFTAERCRRHLRASLVPLRGLPDWVWSPYTIERADRRYFRVVGVSVQAGSREVIGWRQPLIEPVAQGICAFLTYQFDGVPHVLASARVECGFRNTVELGPTLQCVPGNYRHLSPAERPRYLDDILGADASRILYEAVHSEEGGRFLNAQSRYMFVRADDRTAAQEPPPGFCWISIGQMAALLRHSHYVNVQARSLVACVITGAASI